MNRGDIGQDGSRQKRRRRGRRVGNPELSEMWEKRKAMRGKDRASEKKKKRRGKETKRTAN